MIRIVSLQKIFYGYTKFYMAFLRQFSYLYVLLYQNHTLMYKKQCVRKKPFFQMHFGSYIVPCIFDSVWYLISSDKYLLRMNLLRLLIVVLVPRIKNCRYSFWNKMPIWKFLLYSGFANCATIADVTWKGHPSTKRTDKAGRKQLAAAPVSSNENSEALVNCNEPSRSSIKGLADLRVNVSVLLRRRYSDGRFSTRHSSAKNRYWAVPTMVFACQWLLCRIQRSVFFARTTMVYLFEQR